MCSARLHFWVLFRAALRNAESPAGGVSIPHGALAGLTPCKRAVALQLVDLVRTHVPARLQNAAVFGSTARAEAAPSSDVDVLLIFRRLSPDREPHASLAEKIAAQLSERRGVVIEPWSVSLPDLRQGRRTPMLVDALADALPLWPLGMPLPRPPFTMDDAHFCVGRLLARIREGGPEVAWLARSGRHHAAARRVRDDLVRGCVAALLLRRDTRPRRAQAVRSFVARFSVPRGWQPVLHWAAASFGPEGRDEKGRVKIPPGGLAAGARVVSLLAEGLSRETLAPRAV